MLPLSSATLSSTRSSPPSPLRPPATSTCVAQGRARSLLTCEEAQLPDGWFAQLNRFDALFFGAVGWPEVVPDHTRQHSILAEISHSEFKPENRDTIVDQTIEGLMNTKILRESDRIRKGESENFEGLIDISSIIRDGLK